MLGLQTENFNALSKKFMLWRHVNTKCDKCLIDGQDAVRESVLTESSKSF